MASSRIDHGRYEISSGAKELSATKSISASANLNITANDFNKPMNPSGYMAFVCGVYTPEIELVVRYINPQNTGTDTLTAIRNISANALNNKEIDFKYTYIRNDMIDDQRT